PRGFITKGAEIFLRMRLKGQHGQGYAGGPRLLRGFTNKRAMAQMDAVEIAHRHDAAAQARRDILEMAKNPHQAFGLFGASTLMSDSSTAVSPTLQMQLSITWRPSMAVTVQITTTVSPIRTGALKAIVALTK